MRQQMRKNNRPMPQSTIPTERIDNNILAIRGHKAMIDADLAALYGVTTKRLNQQVRRNIERFPEDFMFELNAREKAEVVANCNHLAKPEGRINTQLNWDSQPNLWSNRCQICWNLLKTAWPY
jgi:hypothetical protein